MNDATEAVVGVFRRIASGYDTVIPYFSHWGRRLVDLAALRPGESVLDVACGRGASLIPAVERVGPGGRVLGVDLAEEMVALLREDLAGRGLVNAEVRMMDAQALDLPDESFDVVLCGFTLWLLPDANAAAAEFRRVLRPGGRCAVSMPTGTDPKWEFQGELRRRYAPRAQRPVELDVRPGFDQAGTLARGGFEKVEAIDEVGHFVFPDEEAWWAWIWSVGLRAFLEVLPPDALEEFKQEAFEHLREFRAEDGLHLDQEVRFTLGRKG